MLILLRSVQPIHTPKVYAVVSKVNMQYFDLCLKIQIAIFILLFLYNITN